MKTSIVYSINEQRTAFKPTIPTGNNITKVKAPGGHSDVGGGYRQRGLADATLSWMVEQGRSTNAPFNMPDLSKYQMTNDPIMHQETPPPGYNGMEDRNLNDIPNMPSSHSIFTGPPEIGF